MENIKKDTPLKSINFGSSKLIDVLIKMGFKTIEDTISLPKEELEKKISIYLNNYLETMILMDKFTSFLHSYGFIFKEEYNHLEIGEAATLPINKIKIPVRIKRKMQSRLGVNILGELLDYDRDSLLADKLIAKKDFETLEESLQQLGYKFITKKINKDTLIKELSLSNPEIKKILIKNGYKTIGDITEASKEDIITIFENASSSEYHPRILIDNLSYYLHIKGFTYKNEFKNVNVNDSDILLFPIDDLELSTRTKNSLNNFLSIYFLGELLDTSYEILINSPGMGKVSVDELQNCIKNMGYELKNPVKVTNDTLLKDVYFSNKDLKKLLLEMGCITIGDITLLYRSQIEDELNKRYSSMFSQWYMDDLKKFLSEIGISLKGEIGNLDDDILVEHIDYLTSETKKILISSGYKTIKDIISVPKDEIEKIFYITKNHITRDGKEFVTTYFDKYCMNILTEFLHISGYTYKGEFDDLGIDYEILMKPIKNLKISEKLKNTLISRANGMSVLGDILNTSMEDIIKSRNFGQKALTELKDYIHSIGYMLKDEKLTFEEVLQTKKESKIKLLEKSIDDARIYMPLYRNGIFTIEDLKSAGSSVFEIKAFSGKKGVKLKEIMKKLNIYFEEPEEEQLDKEILQVIDEEQVELVKQENKTIQERLEKKKSLLEEYNSLIEERKALLAREVELDKLIEEKLHSLKEGSISVNK